MRKNIQGKKQEVEDQRRNVKLSKNKTSLTAWLNHNLFSVSQFCDVDLEVAFRKSTCYIRDLKGNDLLTEGILHQTSVARTPEQNGVVERRNRTLVEAARTMLSAAKVPLFFWAKAIATAVLLKTVLYVRDGENLDKMKEKGDECIFVGYSTQSRAYRVFNKRTRVIMESIHVNFNELPQMASAHNSSDPALTYGENLDKMKEKGDACIFVGYSTQSRAYRVFNKRTRVIVETIRVNFDELPQMASDHVTGIVTTSNELDLLFSLMFDELLNGSAQVVSKSFAVTTANALNQCQQQNTTPLNTQSTPDPTYDEFVNIFCTPLQDRGETSSRHVDSSNMHTFYQQHPSKHHWTKDHPLEQVIRNPSQSVRTRRQLESDGEMCMFALTVSRTEPKNIKEAMADSA
nr:hypothetical protein [Tanacetum cinerariifolium]